MATAESVAFTPRRIGILALGFPRKPFTVPIASVDVALKDPMFSGCVSEMIALRRPYLCTAPVRHTYSSFLYHYMTFFVALAATDGPTRFLRLDDADTMELMRPTLDTEKKELYTADALRVVDRGTPILSLLASHVGCDPLEWQPAAGEIHLIVAAMHSDLFVDTAASERFAINWTNYMKDRRWPARPDLVATCTGEHDIDFHATKRGSTRFSLFGSVRQGRTLPSFHSIVVRRQRCGMPPPPPNGKWTPPPNKQATPHRLSRLAGDVLLPHLLRSDPPLFLDAVDCVVDAAIVTASGVIVRDNVTCYIKYLPTGQGEPIYSPSNVYEVFPSHAVNRTRSYVNPEMLEQLDWIVTAGEDTSGSSPPLRLLVFVLHFLETKYRIDSSRLPTEFPTIIAMAER